MDRDPTALARYAPAAGAALEALEPTVWAVADRIDRTDLAALAAQVCAGQFGLPPLTPPQGEGERWQSADPARWASIPGLDASTRDVLAFAQQFSLDVAAITDEQRRIFFHALGAAAGDFAAVVFVIDFLPRSRAGLAALFGPQAQPAGTGIESPDDDLWAAFDAVIRTVPRLDALDPVTSELVRLRGARQHRCRLCQSLRSRPALLAGADEAAFDAVDDYGHSDLSPSQKTALTFTDALLWTPAHIEPTLAEAVVAQLGPAAGVELVLDVTRNALNKIAVALAADDPHVDEGVEIYDIDPSGDLVYGVSLS